MKKAFALLLLLCCLAGIVGCGKESVIGTISGAENEYITIDEVTYVKADDHPFSSKDRGTYLGDAANANITMRIYSVIGDENGDYIYALWDWEGSFYIRRD